MKAFLGVLEFQENEYEELKELCESLKTKQKPHTLFISCVNSRVVPNLITGTKPGELYVIRNMGNVIPSQTSHKESLSTIASIEYAIMHAGIQNVIICGHSNCGACESIHLIDNKTTKVKTPYTTNWIQFLEPIKKELKDHPQFSSHSARRSWFTERLNVHLQLNNLLSYDFIQEKVIKNELKIFGWHYIIETGKIYNYNFESHFFEPIEETIKQRINHENL
ncbi:carbonic anhydrase [Helicobacter acinonychis]|uniref:carbonic anhydrase n=1 Tax=Helicobacter acinonychis TaxID=212 RepID=UPI000CF0D783|nr:carbonic anhydrase [Helicobacter acinonychis]